MTDILVTSPYRPFTLPTQFKAVFNGYIYCGTVDAVDPSVSQVQVYLANEDGSRTPVAQPLRTNAGGFLVYNGQPAKFVTDSNHSLLVHDSLHVQVWYAPDVAIVDPETIWTAITSGDGAGVIGSMSYSDVRVYDGSSDLIYVHGRNNVFDGANGYFQLKISDVTSADDDGVILVDSLGRRWHRQISGPIMPQWYGADPSGVADSTSAIAKADAYVRANNHADGVYIGAGEWSVSQVVINTKSRFIGCGKRTVLKQIIGSNKDLIYGVNSNANTGLPLSSATGFPYEFHIEGITLNGNWNGGSGNTVGSGFWVYGDHYVVKDLYVFNCAEHGVRKEALGDSPVNYADPFLETSFTHIRVDYVGKHGFYDAGPHDSLHSDVIVLDAGQSLDENYDGFIYTNSTSSRNVAIHAASRSGRLRMRYAVNCEGGSTSEFSGGCNIEGAGVANLRIASSKNQFDPSTRIYAPFGGINIFLDDGATLNVIKGTVDEKPLPELQDAIGVYFSRNASHQIGYNDIELLAINQNGGTIDFGGGNKGSNTIRIKQFNSDNVAIIGTPHNSDSIFIDGAVNGGDRIKIDTDNQTQTVSILPAATGTFNFAYPFPSSPGVSVAILTPTVAPDKYPWISAISGTAYSIFNPNASSITVSVNARKV